MAAGGRVGCSSREREGRTIDISAVHPEHLADRHDLGRALTALREHAGLTVRELAARLNVPPATIGGYVTARHLPSPGQLPVFTALLRECGVAEADLDAWIDALTRARTTSDGRARRAPSPYPGLAPFGEQDADAFFGRDNAIRLVLDRLRERLTEPGAGNPALAVVGASGSGKSSLLRAGVLPAVRAGALGADIQVATATLMTPSPDPLEALHRSLAEHSRLLVVDQFEELFTVCTTGERHEFLKALAGLDPRSTAVLIGLRADFYSAALGEASLVPVLQHGQVVVPPLTQDELRSAIVGPAESVGVMVDGALVDVLLAEFTPGRASASIARAATLPLLSHSLLATWSRARGTRLTLDDYRATGGIEGAVQQSAEEAFLDFDPQGQDLIRRLFLRLANVDDDIVITRRRVQRSELEALGDEQDEHAASVSAIIDSFVDRRLLTVDMDGVEVSHEALLSAWPRLHDWFAADRDGQRLLRQLTRATNSWDQGGRDDSLLLRGTRLDAMRELAGDPDRGAELNALEREYVEAGTAAAQREQQAARRRARRLQRLLTAVAVLALVASGLAVYAIDAGIVAREQRSAANQARDDALSRQVAIEARQLRGTDPALADQLALVAYRISPTSDARSVLIDASSYRTVTRVLGSPGPTALAQRPDGKVIAVSRPDDGSVRLYRTRGDEPPQPLGVVPGQGDKGQLFALAFSPDGKVLATGGESKQVRLWDVADPARPHSVSMPTPAFATAVQALRFSPDGHTLVAVGSGPAALRWDVSDPAHPHPLGAPADLGDVQTAQALAYSPDGTMLAVGGAEGRLLIWTGPSRTEPVRLSTGSSTITTVAFSPDNRVLAVGSKDGSLNLWDVTDAAAPRRMSAPASGFTTWLNVLAFSPDGRRLAAGSSDRNVRVWDTSTWTVVETMPHPGPITGLTFSADGAHILSTSADGSLHSWTAAMHALPVDGSVFTLGFTHDGSLLNVTTTGPQSAAALWHISAVPSRPGFVAPTGDLRVRGASTLSADGRLLATGTGSGPVLLWNVSDPAAPRRLGAPLTGASALVESLALSPDSALLAAGADDNAVHLWDVRDPTHPRLLPKLDTKSLVLGVTFNATGTLLAAAVADNTARLWDVRDPSQPRLVATLGGFESYAWSAGFSPDGKILAVSSADHTTRLWNVADPGHPRQLGGPLTGPRGYATGVSFTPDGKTLAVSGEDQSVWLYDISDPAHPSVDATLRSLNNSVYAVTFAPNGRTLAAAGGDKVVRVWDTDPEDVAGEICRTGGDAITPAEWADYVPGVGYRPPCR